MPEAAELARDFPGTRIVVNHAGLPETRDAETLGQWRTAMAPLASCPNVLMKISGLGVRGEAWTIGQQAPVVDALIADFGVERCLFASNHPVDAIVVKLDDLWAGFKTLTRKLNPEQRLTLFCDNAVALYGLH
jgi:predicted TIM-barrel fold metal-dependent hydrolase